MEVQSLRNPNINGTSFLIIATSSDPGGLNLRFKHKSNWVRVKRNLEVAFRV